MDARQNPEYLRATMQAVSDFRAALVEFLELHVVNESIARGVAPAVFPRDDADPAMIAAVATRVARASGLAVDAVPLTNAYMVLEGVGKVDPIANWRSMTNPKPVVEADDVLSTTDLVLGRLEAMTLKAEAEAPPEIGAAAMHPLVWGAASRLWRDRHYRVAVAAAGEALVGQVKALTGRRDVPETALWQETFSERAPVSGKPRLRWPGNPLDRDVKTMNDGLRQFAPGVQMTIRNPAAHGEDEFTEQEALERLATLSLLARWVDECDVAAIPGE